jgi:hypothetical protein
MFTELEEINSRPDPFQYYSAEELWTDPPSPDKSGFGEQAGLSVSGKAVR